MNPLLIGILIILAIIVGCVVGFLIRKHISEGKINNAEELAKSIIRDAEKNGEAQKKEMLLEAKDEAHRLLQEAAKENKERRSEVQKAEKRIIQREETLDKRTNNVEKKEEQLNEQFKTLETKEKKADELIDQRTEELEKVANLTSEEAKVILLSELEKELAMESALMIKESESRIREESDKMARDILSTVIQRYAADHVAETTVSVVSLPNDEMKGRIIGREGRNIRTLESLTGIDLIIDDTPEAVVLSGFDPMRREVARIALEKLVIDGRIHPTRIEEMVNKAKREVEQSIKEAGEQATFDTGVHGLHPELIKILGRLKYRTSYGQNVLKHSIEVSTLAGMMAHELGADVKVAKRAGLLHDIGKALDHEIEGPHIDIGVDIAKRYKENDAVIHGIAAHHGDIEAKTVEAVLVQAADAISAARPCARRETLESYIKRLEKLEEIANSFDGVNKCFAIQAGREVRIIVEPDKISELEMVHLAKNVVQKIEEEMEYPGQIKINLIRETRTVDFAK
ncbi:MAG: ribonuclease Y [Tissierellia bacterium]|nr:ribonuclease Y [Tissierellia bacterium]